MNEFPKKIPRPGVPLKMFHQFWDVNFGVYNRWSAWSALSGFNIDFEEPLVCWRFAIGSMRFIADTQRVRASKGCTIWLLNIAMENGPL